MTHRLSLLVNGFAVSALLFLGGTVWAQQGTIVSSSLDQTATITSRGAHASQAPAGPVALPESFSSVLLVPGDTLQLTIYNAPELNGTLTVDPAGNVSVPLAGLVSVSNINLRTAEQKIRQALIDKEELVSPQVALLITGYPQTLVTVAGEVQQPGRFPIVAPESVLDLIASAGGITTAAGGQIEIDHPGPSGPAVQSISFANGRPPDQARQTFVYPGDTVFVRRAGVVYVLGAVNRPGGYLMVNGDRLNVPQAVALANGTQAVATTSHAIVVRNGPNGPEKIEVALRAQDKGDQTPFVLQAGDMLYVPTSGLKLALFNSSSVLSAAASAAIYTTATR